jgi:hypothetical protein
MITKTEWTDWKTNSVTRAFFEAAMERIEDAKDILGNTAGIDQAQDNYFRGFIQAYNEMQGFSIEDVQDD